MLAAYGLFCGDSAVSQTVVTRLGWIGLASIAGAIALTIWDRSARLSLCGLYTVGLTALCMQWQRVPMSPQHLCWQAASELAAFVLLAALLGWLIVKPQSVWRWLRVPCEPERWPNGWFMVFQSFLAAIAAGICVWVSIDFAFDELRRSIAVLTVAGRFEGVLGMAMLVGATILMAWQAPRSDAASNSWRQGWQSAAWAAALLLLSCIGWATLDPIHDPTIQQAPMALSDRDCPSGRDDHGLGVVGRSG